MMYGIYTAEEQSKFSLVRSNALRDVSVMIADRQIAPPVVPYVVNEQTLRLEWGVTSSILDGLQGGIKQAMMQDALPDFADRMAPLPPWLARMEYLDELKLQLGLNLEQVKEGVLLSAAAADFPDMNLNRVTYAGHMNETAGIAVAKGTKIAEVMVADIFNHLQHTTPIIVPGQTDVVRTISHHFSQIVEEMAAYRHCKPENLNDTLISTYARQSIAMFRSALDVVEHGVGKDVQHVYMAGELMTYLEMKSLGFKGGNTIATTPQAGIVRNMRMVWHNLSQSFNAMMFHRCTPEAYKDEVVEIFREGDTSRFIPACEAFAPVIEQVGQMLVALQHHCDGQKTTQIAAQSRELAPFAQPVRLQ